jgi:hypothetical protein
MKNLRFVYLNSTRIAMMAIMLLLPMLSLAIQSYTTGQQLNVLAISGMNLRDAPKGNVLKKIPYGASIKTLQAKSTTNPETIEGIQGNWVKVEYNGAMGFLFDGFLSTLPPPESNGADLHLYAKKWMSPLSDYLEIDYHRFNMGPSVRATQLFKLKSDTVVYFSDVYYEGGTEILSIPNISLEEAYLLAKANFAEIYETTIKAGPEAMESDITYQPDALNRFILNGISEVEDGNGNVSEVKDFYTCPLINGCYFEITIRKHDNRIFIIAGGGC